MTLSNLHTNWVNGSYTNDRDIEVKISENNDLYTYKTQKLNAHVSGTSIDVGYGYDLFQNLSALQTDLQAFVKPCSDLDMVYHLINEYLNKGNPKEYNLPTLATEINKYFDFGTEDDASDFLAHKLDGFETTLNDKLGYTVPQSRERAALLSLCYNRPALLTNTDPQKSIANAVSNDDRIRGYRGRPLHLYFTTLTFFDMRRSCREIQGCTGSAAPYHCQRE